MYFGIEIFCSEEDSNGGDVEDPTEQLTNLVEGSETSFFKNSEKLLYATVNVCVAANIEKRKSPREAISLKFALKYWISSSNTEIRISSRLPYPQY